jgi:multisite-specific tRNA:(cytosine-C5)-methyltransferase
MLPKEERKAMLLRLYNDNSELIDHSKNRDREANARETEAKAATKQEESATPGADIDGGVKLDAQEPDVTKPEGTVEEPFLETVIAEEEVETANGEKMETEA